MKLLLYCTKSKPYLYRQNDDCFEVLNKIKYEDISDYEKYYGLNNGKVVGECDFEIEKIIYRETDKNSYSFGTDTLTPNELLERSCLTTLELCKYIGSNPNWTKGDYGYAIHIKNLTIFDTPKELSDYYHSESPFLPITKAPQNMMYCNEVITSDFELGDKVFKNAAYQIKHYVLVSVQPQWLCKILNGEKTIEVRKVVPNGMLISGFQFHWKKEVML